MTAKPGVRGRDGGGARDEAFDEVRRALKPTIQTARMRAMMARAARRAEGGSPRGAISNADRLANPAPLEEPGSVARARIGVFREAVAGVVRRRRAGLLRISRFVDLKSHPSAPEPETAYEEWDAPQDGPVWLDEDAGPETPFGELIDLRDDQQPDPVDPTPARLSDERSGGRTARFGRSARMGASTASAFWGVIVVTTLAASALVALESDRVFVIGASFGQTSLDQNPEQAIGRSDDGLAERAGSGGDRSGFAMTMTPPAPDGMASPRDVYAVEERAYLDQSTLRALIAQRPVKCVLADRGAAGRGAECVETVVYQPDAFVFTSFEPLSAGSALSISGEYRFRNDALCHLTRGLRAVVTGGAIAPGEAFAHERIAEADYAAIPGGAVCYRFAPTAPGANVFVADAYISDRAAPARTDPRPFELRPAAAAPRAAGLSTPALREKDLSR